ncbi:hypothetical protein B0H12DRAFT_208784 [Mycena haematopus]|nr:hypothetical protein B0H12DRAFT_208784 [Mycena haematopus]
MCAPPISPRRSAGRSLHANASKFPPSTSSTGRWTKRDALQVKLAQYERFLGLMISVGLHQRVLGDAHAALRAGIDPDQSLVDAIKEAAAVPGSPWSTIIPSVTGPRTPDEYRSSLTLTLNTRKELRDAKKVAKFWKRIACEEADWESLHPLCRPSPLFTNLCPLNDRRRSKN